MVSVPEVEKNSPPSPKAYWVCNVKITQVQSNLLTKSTDVLKINI